MGCDGQEGSPLRILMAVPQYPFPVVGGLEKQAHELASELVRQGHYVQVLSGRIHPSQPDLEEVDGVVVHRLPWPRARQVRWLTMPILVWRLFARVKKDVGVVHCHVFSGFGLFMIILAKCARVPILVKLPSVGRGSLPGLTGGFFGQLRGALFKRADAIVALSQQSLDELEQFGFDMNRVLATPNGIRTQSVDSLRRIQEALCRMVFVGRLHPEKGLKDLIDALRLVEARCPNRAWCLDVVGDGEQMPLVNRWIHEAGLAGKIRLLGHRDGVADLLQQYEMLLLPSYREGNSNVILEAMAARVAVISTRVGGTPMLVGPRGREWLHDPGDIEALAVLVVRLLEEPGQRKALGQVLRQRISDHFEIEVVARTYAAAYQKLIAGKGSELALLSDPVVTDCASVAPSTPENRL